MKRSISRLWWLPLGILVLAVVAVATARFGASNEAESNAPANETVLPIVLGAQEPEIGTPGLLNRLASAGKACMPGSTFWIVANPVFPYDVVGELFPEQASAERQPEIEEGYQVYGPFECDEVRAAARGFAPCPHNRITTEPDCQRITGIPPRDLGQVDSAKIFVWMTTGEQYEWQFSPETYDLVFFSLGAFETFLMPYYVERSGIEYAEEMRDSMEAFFGRPF